MPSGRVHAAMSIFAAAGLYWVAARVGASDAACQALATGCLAGTVITPDLDVDQPTRSHYLIGRKFGLMLALAWRLLWLPYGLSIKHRSWVSHMPLVGTAVRVVYLACFAVLLGSVSLLAGWQAPRLEELLPFFPAAFLGLSLSDLLHWASDGLWSGFKRRMKKRYAIKTG